MSLISLAQDVSKEKLKSGLPIDLIGIRNLKIPVYLDSKIRVPAKLSLFVSLDDKTTRGIHISRLYLLAHKYFSKEVLSFSGLKMLLKQSIKCQKGISKSGRIYIESQLPVLRKALKSDIEGWREYPFHMELNYSGSNKSWEYIAGSEILYSSTCPCSAALSQEVIKKNFEEFFPLKKSLTRSELKTWLRRENFLKAVPHAQKSKAVFKVKLKERSKDSFSVLKYIEELEAVLTTAVQTAVKREDEAEFAKRNADNLMFCEDALRKLALCLKNKKNLLDYYLRVQHYESLHPFTVESSAVKGVSKGWRV